MNLKIEYPPLYERIVWDYKKVNTQLLNRTIETFNWEKLLENKNVNEQLYLFNKTMLNIFHNFIPNKNIICNDKDPPWFNNHIKTLIEKKNHLFKSYMANGRLAVDRVRLQKAGAELINIIKSPKENFYKNLAKKLNDPNTSSKTYWSIMKTFVNGKNLLIIPPLLVNNNLISNFREKANIFKDFFVQQCQRIANNSILPTNQIYSE